MRLLSVILGLFFFGYRAEAQECSRVVSLAPSITEVIYALDLGSRIVGNTRYCTYPADAATKTKVGGFMDPNNEVIVSLKPTLVLLLAEQNEEARYLSALGIRTTIVEHRSIDGILKSITTIGALCNEIEKAKNIVDGLSAKVNSIREAHLGSKKPRVLIALGGDVLDGKLANLYISGKDGYYDQILEILGAENVYTGGTTSLPSVSKEGLIAINPDVVFQINSPLDGVRINPTSLQRAWGTLTMINAVKNKRVFVLGEDYASIPGPRFILLIEEMERLLYETKG